MRHSALLSQQREMWQARSDKVSVEHQNSFRLRGETAILAARPRNNVLSVMRWTI